MSFGVDLVLAWFEIGKHVSEAEVADLGEVGEAELKMALIEKLVASGYTQVDANHLVNRAMLSERI